jgi:hypothetical protein
VSGFEVFLTDDEIVAIAAEHGQPWPTPLPTVATRSPAAVDAAARRGWRSLSVRERAGDRLPLDRLRRWAGAELMVQTYVTDADLSTVDGASRSAYYRGAGPGWLIEVTVPTGVHAFRSAPVPDCARLIEAAVDDAMTSGAGVPGGQGGGFFVLRLAPSGSGPTRLLAANRDGLELWDRADELVPRPMPAPESSAAALTLLGLPGP